MITKPTKCLVCKSSNLQCIIPHVNDYITNEVFQIFHCKDCEVNFTYPIPEDMSPYYPKKYRKYGLLVMTLLQMLYRFRVSSWVKMFGKPGRALEIGCGQGIMLAELKKKGWDVVGIERTKEVAEQAKKSFGLEIISTGVETLPKEKRFDLIILFNVLEHMNNPRFILKECVERLNPGGFLVVSLHNFDSWQYNFSRHLWLHLDPPRHIFHFSKKSLTNIFKMEGLEICKVGFVSFEHDPFGWIQSTINKFLKRTNVLTRYLMGLEKLNGEVILSFLLALILAIPCLFLSLISWIMKKGSMIEVVATLPIEKNKLNSLI